MEGVMEILSLVSIIWGEVARLFRRKPKPTNDTVSEISKQIEAQANLRCADEGRRQAEAQRQRAEDALETSRRTAEADRQRAEERHQAQLAEARRRLDDEHNARLREADRLASQEREREQQLAEIAASRLEAERQRGAAKQNSEEMIAKLLQAEANRVASQKRAEEALADFRRESEAKLVASQKAQEEVLRAAQRRADEELQTELAAAKRRRDEEIAAVKLKADQDIVASQQRAQSALKEADDARSALQRGIQPLVWPTKQQLSDALMRIKYDPEKLHFAVCGSSGSGKSSLINALRGLASKDSGAAKTGVTETTSRIGRYPDTRQDYPHSRFVWFDIPGAGTLKVRDWQYFNDQGLFVFDFIIVVYDARFTSIDVDIIKNCNRFEIPVFVVRSKADQHIANMAADEDGCEQRDPRYEQVYQEKLGNFCDRSRSDFYQQIEMMKEESKQRERGLDKSNSNYDKESRFESSYQQFLSKQIVYIVSSKKLCTLLSTDLNKRKTFEKTMYIDERLLHDALLSAAALRRYSGSNNSNEDASLFKALALSTPAMICNRQTTSDSGGEY